MQAAKMMEHVLVIIKPDALERGLSKVIHNRFTREGLNISLTRKLQLSYELTASLYRGFDFSPHFKEMVKYISNSPVEILIVSGENAIEQVKEIKGEVGTKQGIRGSFATSNIYNLLHSSDCIGAANREMSLILGNQAEPFIVRPYTIFALIGMDKCGKTAASEYLGLKGVLNLKVYEFIDELRIGGKRFEGMDTEKFFLTMSKERPFCLWGRFLPKLESALKSANATICSFESFCTPPLGQFLHKCYGERFVLVYIDARFETRLVRQIEQENSPQEIAKVILKEKDRFKENAYQMSSLRSMADVIIDNNGQIQQLYLQVDNMLRQYLDDDFK